VHLRQTQAKRPHNKLKIRAFVANNPKRSATIQQTIKSVHLWQTQAKRPHNKLKIRASAANPSEAPLSNKQ